MLPTFPSKTMGSVLRAITGKENFLFNSAHWTPVRLWRDVTCPEFIEGEPAWCKKEAIRGCEWLFSTALSEQLSDGLSTSMFFATDL